MKPRTEDWENELWSLINIGDGTNCPLYESCQHRKHSKDCLSRDINYADAMHKFLDDDSLILPPLYKKFCLAPVCVESSKIFKLVKKLAQNYAEKAGVDTIPVKTEIIKKLCFDQPVE